MTYEHILIDAEDGVGIVTLNRPDKLNATNRQLSSELHDAVKRMEADEAIGCIVITGAGERAFSAGGDIHEQREDDRRYTEEELDAHRPPRRGAYEIAACAKPTIGMINGLAYGGAAVLASSLDMRVLRGQPLSLSRGGLWTDKQHLDAPQPGWLADRQGAVVHGARRGSRRSIPHRSVEPSRPARAAAGQDHGAGAHDRRQQPRLGHGDQGIIVRHDGAEPRTAMDQGAVLHDARRQGRQGGGGLS
jgi:Enoyl-CoA hydratase/isomerase